MKFPHLFSMKFLVSMGFIIAVMPLLAAVLYAAIALRETAELGRSMNYQVFEQTKTIRLVLQRTYDIERKARLFVLLADPALRRPYERKSYETARASFKQALGELLLLPLDNKIALLANELSEKEALVYQQIVGSKAETQPKLPVDEAFLGMREASNTLSREFETRVDHEFNELRQQSESRERALLTQFAVLLGGSLVFMAMLLAFLGRSMRQLDSSIHKLGSGNLAEPIRISGPSDLRRLGGALESLRTRLLELETCKQPAMCEAAMPLEDRPHGRITAKPSREPDSQDAEITRLLPLADEA